MEINIIQIKNNKKQYLDLLLLGDEEEAMIDKYIERGDMYALFKGELISICIVTNEGNGICELKNLATYPHFQGKGYGKTLLDYLCNLLKNKYSTIIVGTGDSDLTIPFYKKCGFKESHKIKDFFIKNYSKPIFENGKQLIDMIYLKKNL